jgi:hypothetical protein
MVLNTRFGAETNMPCFIERRRSALNCRIILEQTAFIDDIIANEVIV